MYELGRPCQLLLLGKGDHATHSGEKGGWQQSLNTKKNEYNGKFSKKCKMVNLLSLLNLNQQIVMKVKLRWVIVFIIQLFFKGSERQFGLDFL